MVQKPHLDFPEQAGFFSVVYRPLTGNRGGIRERRIEPLTSEVAGYGIADASKQALIVHLGPSHRPVTSG
ncbi:MAG: hypothetical protein H6555_10010 [Lewinellaceae bacterium]|nr:hypothetical protein [Lewinellaceae bacterium]